MTSTGCGNRGPSAPITASRAWCSTIWATGCTSSTWAWTSGGPRSSVTGKSTAVSSRSSYPGMRSPTWPRSGTSFLSHCCFPRCREHLAPGIRVLAGSVPAAPTDAGSARTGQGRYRRGPAGPSGPSAPAVPLDPAVRSGSRDRRRHRGCRGRTGAWRDGGMGPRRRTAANPWPAPSRSCAAPSGRPRATPRSDVAAARSRRRAAADYEHVPGADRNGAERRRAARCSWPAARRAAGGWRTAGVRDPAGEWPAADPRRADRRTWSRCAGSSGDFRGAGTARSAAGSERCPAARSGAATSWQAATARGATADGTAACGMAARGTAGGRTAISASCPTAGRGRRAGRRRGAGGRAAASGRTGTGANRRGRMARLSGRRRQRHVVLPACSRPTAGRSGGRRVRGQRDDAQRLCPAGPGQRASRAAQSQWP